MKENKSLRKCQIRKKGMLGLLFSLMLLWLAGCGAKTEGVEKLRDLEFTVLKEEEYPKELTKMMEEQGEAPYKITYTDGEYLYIAVGYGKQKTGGYSVTVNDLFLTENAVYIDTNLLGPSAEETKQEVASFPRVVVKTEYIDKKIVFD